MKQDDVLHALHALASPARLDIFRLLVRHGPQGRVAGELGEALGISPSNLSFHLKALAEAGLIQSAAEGRFQRYRADLARMAAVIAYLTENCCDGRPELCAELPAAQAATARKRSA